MAASRPDPTGVDVPVLQVRQNRNPYSGPQVDPDLVEPRSTKVFAHLAQVPCNNQVTSTPARALGREVGADGFQGAGAMAAPCWRR